MPADAAEIVRLAEELCGKDVYGSSWLDGRIAFAIGYFTPEHLDLYQRWLMDEGDWEGPVPVPPSEYSGSLDAAMTLVPEDGFWEVDAHGCAKVSADVKYDCEDETWYDRETFGANANTPALALTAAALRARAAQHDREVG